MKTNTRIRPVIHYVSVEVLSIMEVKRPRKTHKCHRCDCDIDSRHLAISMMSNDEFCSIRECRTCTAEQRYIHDQAKAGNYDNLDGSAGSLLVTDEK